ncbi:unannotated protein [freshwater metagenome]|uniref:Unannotated protein n=1 Tax=freshwater metagenome TaxID=449393 RepID=A0A6J7QA08_9ZZZZ
MASGNSASSTRAPDTTSALVDRVNDSRRKSSRVIPGSHSCATSGSPPVMRNASNASKGARPVMAATSRGVRTSSTSSVDLPWKGWSTAPRCSIIARSLPSRSSSTGLAASTLSQTRCSSPAPPGMPSSSQGTSSITTIDGPLSGSAAASSVNAAVNVVGVFPAATAAPGKVDDAIASAKAASSAVGFAPRAAWKYSDGSPARAMSSVANRDLPTRRRPRSATAMPRSSRRPRWTSFRSRASSSSSRCLPTNVIAHLLQHRILHSRILLLTEV